MKNDMYPLYWTPSKGGTYQYLIPILTSSLFYFFTPIRDYAFQKFEIPQKIEQFWDNNGAYEVIDEIYKSVH